MKLLAATMVTALTFATSALTPALAGETGHSRHHHRHPHSRVVVQPEAVYGAVPSSARDFTPYAYGADPDPMNVYVDGRFIGRDPDPNVRQQFKNDYDLSQGGR